MSSGILQLVENKLATITQELIKKKTANTTVEGGKRRERGRGPGRLHPCTRTQVKSAGEVRCSTVGSGVTVQSEVCGWGWGESHAVLVYLTRSFPVPSQKHGL